MKIKLILLCTIFFASLQINAQSDKDCLERLSTYSELTKSKNHEEAYSHLQYLRKECPAIHKAVYLYGVKTLNYKIDNASNEEEKQKYESDLILLYDQYDTNFPNNGRVKTSETRKNN